MTDIVDVGCGTGRYSSALAERFDAQVVGIDPSEKMLEQARAKVSDRVRVERGAAESLPLPDASIDMIFLSMVFHHFDDRERAVAEFRRVLPPGGVVCLRGGAWESIGSYAYVPFFPESLGVLERTFGTRGSIEATFAKAGFRTLRHELIDSEAGANWRDCADRVARRADSILSQLTDADFSRDLAAVRAHAATAPPDEPVTELVDFFAFVKT